MVADRLHLRAQPIRWQVRRDLAPLLARYDALVMPSALGPAPTGARPATPPWTAPWTGLGVPAVSLPTGLAADGLPLGTQLIGGAFEEARLLAAARWAEAAIGFTAAPAALI